MAKQVEVEALRGFRVVTSDGMKSVPASKDKKPSRVQVPERLARELVQANKARYVETASRRAPETAAGGGRVGGGAGR